MLREMQITSSDRNQLIDVTSKVQAVIRELGVESGTAVVFVPHTTAGVTINENADPTVCSDMIRGLADVAPEGRGFYRHDEGNSDSHIKSSLVGPSLTIVVAGGKALLGTWQGIYFAEFDGPRSRRMYVKIQADPD